MGVKSGGGPLSSAYKDGSWTGRAVVCGSYNTNSYWVQHGANFVKVAAEHPRHVVPGEDTELDLEILLSNGFEYNNVSPGSLLPYTFVSLKLYSWSEE